MSQPLKDSKSRQQIYVCKIAKYFLLLDQDEAVHYELPHLDLCCLQIQLFSILSLQVLELNSRILIWEILIEFPVKIDLLHCFT